MTQEIDIAALRKEAQEAAWTGRWYDGGCNTVFCDYNGKPGPEHDEIAHPCPLGITEYLASVNPPSILALLDRLEQAEKERDELRRATTVPMVEKGSQQWAGMSGAAAHHLIERHAENWADVGQMMEEWADARAKADAARLDWLMHRLNYISTEPAWTRDSISAAMQGESA